MLGARIAAHFAEAGARVSAVVRNHERLDGASVSQYALADVTDHAALKMAFASVAPFDGVVNATGVVAFGSVADLDDVTLAQLFAVNAIAPIVMLRESSPHITDGGFFVNLSGVAATTGDRRSPCCVTMRSRPPSSPTGTPASMQMCTLAI
ncbi:MAG: SDR family oxidoreductase [Actinobacteria bacterium]|nr:SDR family oxidoreductase [Actinomycetota bacterium]